MKSRNSAAERVTVASGRATRSEKVTQNSEVKSKRNSQIFFLKNPAPRMASPRVTRGTMEIFIYIYMYIYHSFVLSLFFCSVSSI